MKPPIPIVKEATLFAKGQKDLTALDLGAGRGRNTLFLAGKGYSVDAVDKSSEFLTALKQSAKNGNVMNKIDVYETDLSDFSTEKKYDLVVITNVLHLLNHHTQELLLKKIPTMLNEDGVLVISHILDRTELSVERIEKELSDLKLIKEELKTIEDGPHPGMPFPHQHKVADYIFCK